MANHFKYVCVVDFYLKQYITHIFFYCLVLKSSSGCSFNVVTCWWLISTSLVNIKTFLGDNLTLISMIAGSVAAVSEAFKK